MSTSIANAPVWPAWVPDDVGDYLVHTCAGRSIRSVAREQGCQPSTILRRVRRVENRRDDPLVDLALTRLSAVATPCSRDAGTGKASRAKQTPSALLESARVDEEARRVLRRLAEQGACLAIADGMDTAVVVRDGDDGPALRTAVVERTVAEVLALNAWIEKYGDGRILRYRITAAGRDALRKMLAEDENRRANMHEVLSDPREAHAGRRRQTGRGVRYSVADSPLIALSRRRERDGERFLSDELVAAGERFREDYELARTQPGKTPDWEAIIAGDTTTMPDGKGKTRALEATHRIATAFSTLGPGLGDMVLRCVCRLEGLETAERTMGWSARSGKIVLRIALQRLRLHYETSGEEWSPLIG